MKQHKSTLTNFVYLSFGFPSDLYSMAIEQSLVHTVIIVMHGPRIFRVNLSIHKYTTLNRISLSISMLNNNNNNNNNKSNNDLEVAHPHSGSSST